MAFIVPRIESVQYDGTNGQFIANTFLADTVVVSDDGTTLVLDLQAYPYESVDRYTVRQGEWVIGHAWNGERYRFYSRTPDADYRSQYAELPTSP
ncbi:hypothetical protein HRW18_05390 [Streptomyces lunaelactis]|uniref:hypothetical protein n=1 Tax=Streptomyces lunaelactis TaxID=1535768 RepID=UPI001584688D|nr:hypothetical protein [Streptomyces lunaelactis]NUK07456.1 hypothetical protein [Streptomyces lunaelactis]